MVTGTHKQPGRPGKSGRSGNSIQSGAGVSVLVACLAETLNESDPMFRARFLGRLSAACRTIRDSAGQESLDVLTTTRRLLAHAAAADTDIDGSAAPRALFGPGGVTTVYTVPAGG